jgi:lysozyme family protein
MEGQIVKSLNQILTDLLNREGGYSNDPDDPGGPTNFGITLASWHAYTGKTVNASMVKAITAAVARKYYEDTYVSVYSFIQDYALFEVVLDGAVNHGQGRMNKWLQIAAGVVQDGVIGPKTKAAVNSSDPTRLRLAIVKLRIKEYARLISGNPSRFGKYAAGWINRALEFVV